jgi:hypothetical protein
MMARMDVGCAAHTTTTTCYYRLNEVGGGMREMGEVKTVPKKKIKRKIVCRFSNFLFCFFLFSFRLITTFTRIFQRETRQDVEYIYKKYLPSSSSDSSL